MQIIKPITGFEDYTISTSGDVYSSKKGAPKKLKQSIGTHGYHIVSLSKNSKQKAYLVHRIVATEFIGEIRNGFNVNHKNGIKTDNRLDNLEIVTYSQNIKHAYQIGINSSAKFIKLSKKDVEFICSKLVAMRPCEVSREYGYNYSTVMGIKKGRLHSDISSKYKMKDTVSLQGENAPSGKLTSKDVLSIREMAMNGVSNRDISEKFNISLTTVKNIKSRRTWKNI